ncbi:3-hydroxyacyl-CoA dehydrogenase NAD-binding domain-containing protein (plasmid) [Roseivivax marinus]|uniref:3-hydroxyacyl-CoA dehydrogenase NAD-binding domain-containing protein n=1 Tax=Roseivivax marinus TaxID=1379903 RepID=UPI001F03B4D8|nr:3-hydroxyacyl-CoA dehydrogenase NAD-binding domain-containing protein [Roseivivax marinus]UMA67091.1 3-hydroxyacyl-CoA dehydrogenase NAD-binding domain-containing protein [Roseivivax marinus]
MTNDIRRVAVIGTGLIGSAWATLFLARGLEVVAVDPRENAGDTLRETVSRMSEALAEAGLLDESRRPDPSAITVVEAPGPALAGCGFIQENAPERIELKRELLSAVERHVSSDAILATSTTALRVTDIQTGCARPERVVAGHPLNPPHLVPLVEVSGGELTDPKVVDRAMAFYAAIGKEPVRLNRDIEGHIAGRLSAALWREAVHLVDQGVASVEDIDRAVVHGPGLRWAAVGPHLTYHLGGGSGGMAAYLDHLGESQEKRWKSLGTPTLTGELKGRLAEGTEREAAGRSVADVEADRDAAIARTLKAMRS